MKVSPGSPFQIIYSVYQHEYLGYLFESFVVQEDSKGDLTYQHQNISAKNAAEFDSQLDKADYELIGWMDSMQPEAVAGHFSKKKVHPDDFFLAVFGMGKADDPLPRQILAYLERRRSDILGKLQGKRLFLMGNDGEPAWQEIEVQKEKASVLFNFFRNEDNTHYFPTIKHKGQKVDYQYKGAFLLCHEPAYLVLNEKLYTFEKEVDGAKLKPFLSKKFIAISREMEDTYFKKFAAPVVEQYDVFAKGIEITTLCERPTAELRISDLPGGSTSLFGDKTEQDSGKILLDLKMLYGQHSFGLNGETRPVSVKVQKEGEDYRFLRIKRNPEAEEEIIEGLAKLGIKLSQGRSLMNKAKAFEVLSQSKSAMSDLGIGLTQLSAASGKDYFIGESSMKVEVEEGIDWFDLKSIIRFGDYEIPFLELRKLIRKIKNEIKLPNGQIAIIPESWVRDYADLFHFSQVQENTGQLRLEKYHVALVQEMQNEELAHVQTSRKMDRLRGFSELESAQMPESFKGELRPYQKAGYDWLRFLSDYRLGGCLADDMGLGKTVQTLALLQYQQEQGVENASLLVMPTSLIYNWQREAAKFTPGLKTFIYTGTDRKKDISQFAGYDLILTTYGILRLDVELLTQYYFHYIILDESQVIKNPKSIISKSVKQLKSQHRLILTGTPLENNTMDLWSQLSFANPGLLGTKQYFVDNFQNPIEKKKDEDRIKKLNTLIKPFILRRHKTQVATELPPKVENVHYSEMSPDQAERYKEAKEFYRKKILDKIEIDGLKKSQMTLLQGLTKLRQLANHPALVDEAYQGDSGKMEDVVAMLETVISKGQKVLVFSQFVKHLGLLRAILDKQGLDYAYLDGSTRDREQQVKRFQENPELKLFLISLKAGGLGLNLTQAEYVFLLDPWWNPAVENQAIDRAHRIGQEKKVFTYKFITKDTVEEKILALQERKMALATELITTEESFIKKLSSEDITKLLS